MFRLGAQSRNPAIRKREQVGRRYILNGLGVEWTVEVGFKKYHSLSVERKQQPLLTLRVRRDATSE